MNARTNQITILIRTAVLLGNAGMAWPGEACMAGNECKYASRSENLQAFLLLGLAVGGQVHRDIHLYNPQTGQPQWTKVGDIPVELP